MLRWWWHNWIRAGIHTLSPECCLNYEWCCFQQLTEDEKAERRQKQAAAAESRSKQFQQVVYIYILLGKSILFMVWVGWWRGKVESQTAAVGVCRAQESWNGGRKQIKVERWLISKLSLNEIYMYLFNRLRYDDIRLNVELLQCARCVTAMYDIIIYNITLLTKYPLFPIILILLYYI